MLHAIEEEALANAQALLDNREGKRVENLNMNFPTSHMDHDGTRSKRKESSDDDTRNTQIQAEGLHNFVDLGPPTLLLTGEA